MEKELENKLDKFIGIDYDNDFIYDYGYGDYNGHGYGRGFTGGGNCNGNGDGYEDDYSSLSGYGIDNGDGYGNGPFCGMYNSSGDGYGNGNDGDITFFNGKKVYHIDMLPTIIESVHDNYAKGYILHSDLTLEPCYVAKVDNWFAHDKTLREAFDDAAEKAIIHKPVEKRIGEFLKKYQESDKKIPAKELYEWHGILTGSCRFGRNAFLRDHNIDIDNDEFTVKEFIDLTKNEYGSKVIGKLKNAYE